MIDSTPVLQTLKIKLNVKKKKEKKNLLDEHDQF